MSAILAVNIVGILQSLFCFGLFGLLVGLVIWAGIKETRLKAGVQIPLDDVPHPIRKMADWLVPQLDLEKFIVKYRKKDVPRKYEFHGQLNGNQIEVEVMPRDSAPFVREMEVIYDMAYRRLEQHRPVKLSQVPPRVTRAAIDHMDSIGSTIKKVDRALAGMILGETAYDLKGRWSNGRFEMKVLASGEIIKVELKFRKIATH